MVCDAVVLQASPDFFDRFKTIAAIVLELIPKKPILVYILFLTHFCFMHSLNNGAVSVSRHLHM